MSFDKTDLELILFALKEVDTYHLSYNDETLLKAIIIKIEKFLEEEGDGK